MFCIRLSLEEFLKVYILIFVTTLQVGCVEDDSYNHIDNILKSYDTLHHATFTHNIVKRSAPSLSPAETHVQFDTLGRHFHLVLKPDNKLLDSDFRVVAVDKHNKAKVVDFKPVYYHGYLEGESGTTRVNAYFDDDNTLTAAITTKDDVYLIEPSSPHLPDSSNYSMISYRRSDLQMEKDLGKNFCGYVDENLSTSDAEFSQRNEQDLEQELKHDNNQTRSRRDTSDCSRDGKTACALLLVADYKFYKAVGLGDIAKTTRYIINNMDYIDSIYRGHEFGRCRQMGFTIKEIRIHEAMSEEPMPSYMRFNTDKNDWDTTELLQAFSEDSSFKDFCLAHLFTHIAFDNGVLGLAYIGSSRQFSVGGICSPSYWKAGKELYLNSGWSSSLNRYNRKLLKEELRLVTAHELGHNWGSEHDPDTAECSPAASSGGKYIMYTYSVSGMETNNRIFSPCSRRSMGLVIQAKADTCFIKPKEGFCGNSRVESGEDCDAGPTDDDHPDRCCDSNCKLRPFAQCSDSNSLCCDGCKFSLPDKSCSVAQELLCQGAQTCTGMSADCPPPPALRNGLKCLNNGSCLNGNCISMCEYNNKLSCVSDDVEESCKYCCREKAQNSTCKLFYDPDTNQVLDLPDGVPCIQGYCESGKCIKQVQDRIQRLWKIIENISGDQLVKFMRANIVGTVIILSLVIWIPASCFVALIDRRRAAKEKQEREWYNPESTKMFYTKDNIKVVKPDSVKFRPAYTNQPTTLTLCVLNCACVVSIFCEFVGNFSICLNFRVFYS